MNILFHVLYSVLISKITEYEVRQKHLGDL